MEVGTQKSLRQFHEFKLTMIILQYEHVTALAYDVNQERHDSSSPSIRDNLGTHNRKPCSVVATL